MKNILVDTDFLINLMIKNQSNHLVSHELLKKHQKANFFVSDLVQFELATVLSRILEHQKAIEIFKSIPWEFFQKIVLDQDQIDLAIQKYNSQAKKNISLFDCLYLVIAELHDFKIASFDSFYPKNLLLD